MLNRRVLRIKVLQALYAQSRDENTPTAHYERFLAESIRKVEDVFPYLMALPGAVAHLLNMEGDPLEAKLMPKSADVRYPLMFTDNEVIAWAVKSYDEMPVKKKRIVWHEKKDFLRQLYLEFKAFDKVKVFLDSETWNFETQKEFTMVFIKHFMPQQETLDDIMEDFYMQWSADKLLLFSQCIKAIEDYQTGSAMPQLGKGDLAEGDDEDFSLTLFRTTVQHQKEFEALIAAQAHKWDAERIAQIDMLILKMGLAELLHFPSIPVKVTINECLEISKLYSTPKSSQFINGVLDKLRSQLLAEKKIIKLGRGLVQ